MVLISKDQKRKFYQYLLAEGVLVVRKDSHLPKHRDLGMPNIVVLMLIKSMLSKKYVTEVFSWQYSYFTLNNDGIKFLREYLGVGENVVPETMKKRFHKKEDDEEEEDRPRRGGARGRRGGRGGRFHKDEHEEAAKDDKAVKEEKGKTEEKPKAIATEAPKPTKGNEW